MAVFDPEVQRIVVQVVYDGPAYAGKTTNLEQLCQFFTTHRRSELYSTGGTGQRTLYLDWLALEGGVVAGRKLRCHMLTVPGQSVLAKRRWKVLRRADVVVFVLDSTRGGLSEAKPMFGGLRDYLSATVPTLPLIVQANKQDLVGALPPRDIAQALGVETSSVVAARAASGGGVRETAVIAIRAAADRVQHQILVDGLGRLEGKSETGEQIVRCIEEAERDNPQRPIDIVLAHSRQARQEPATPARDTEAEARLPPLPEAAAASGFIWPSATGRDLLRRVPMEGVRWRRDLAGRVGTQDGSGRPDVVICEAGLWCLKTSTRRQYEDVDEARDALVTLARRKLSLESLLIKQTVLCVQRGEDGSYWLWTVTPWLTTLRAAMSFAIQREYTGTLEESLLAFADAAMLSLRLAQRRQVQLDVHPSNFARLGEHTYYLDDDIQPGGRVPSVGHALIRRVEECAEYPQSALRYIDYVAENLRRDFFVQHAETLGLRESFTDAIVHSPLGNEARERLVDAVSGPHGSRSR